MRRKKFYEATEEKAPNSGPVERFGACGAEYKATMVETCRKGQIGLNRHENQVT